MPLTLARLVIDTFLISDVVMLIFTPEIGLLQERDQVESDRRVRRPAP